MIVVSAPKRHKTQEIKCPHCNTRICDRVLECDGGKVVTVREHNSNLIIKCRKCGRLLGLFINRI